MTVFITFVEIGWTADVEMVFIIIKAIKKYCHKILLSRNSDTGIDYTHSQITYVSLAYP